MVLIELISKFKGRKMKESKGGRGKRKRSKGGKESLRII
jgi:hypothetical protein